MAKPDVIFFLPTTQKTGNLKESDKEILYSRDGRIIRGTEGKNICESL